MMQTRHYYITPAECDTVEKCWQNLSEYLKQHAKGKCLYFRELPQVVSERNFDTKEMNHRGFVRFTTFATVDEDGVYRLPKSAA